MKSRSRDGLAAMGPIDPTHHLDNLDPSFLEPLLDGQVQFESPGIEVYVHVNIHQH